MAHSLDHLAEKVVNKSLNDCSEEELLNLVNRFPYFAPAQFLYLKKVNPQSASYQQQFQRAALYYKDPVLFNQFILDRDNDIETVAAPVIDQPSLLKEDSREAETIEAEVIKETDHSTTSLKESNVADNVISFEPFHTVDYFASQGIKLSLEDASKDKIGKQVKSFTEWLKTMKRLPATQMQNIQGQAEKQVESMAAHSVQTSDVVTEAMAEVWIHQGNKAKAKEVYRKLSLLNPSKSAYFASKIELLNDSN